MRSSGGGFQCDKIQSIDVSEPGGWQKVMNSSCNVQPDLVQAIQQITPPMVLDTLVKDEWTWQPTQHGTYTCSSCYFWLLQEQRGWDHNCDMKWIWRLKVSPNIQHFI